MIECKRIVNRELHAQLAMVRYRCVHSVLDLVQLYTVPVQRSIIPGHTLLDLILKNRVYTVYTAVPGYSTVAVAVTVTVYYTYTLPVRDSVLFKNRVT